MRFHLTPNAVSGSLSRRLFALIGHIYRKERERHFRAAEMLRQARRTQNMLGRQIIPHQRTKHT